MPTYQYACTACGNQLEVVQSFTDEPLTQCPACEGRLRKLFSSVGVVFKGSGFYRTDSRNGADKGADKGAEKGADKKEPAAAPASTSTEKAGSKPAASESKSAAPAPAAAAKPAA